MASNKRYWKSVEELDPSNKALETLRQNEFVEDIPVDEFLGDKEALDASSTTRRDFLKYVGFSTAAATLAACDGPVKRSIPYVVQPERIRPGVANYYATAIADGFDFANILVKTREGRPIKIENNTDAKAFGTANARVHASVLSLYDSLRLKQPKVDGVPASWNTLDTQVRGRLNALKISGKPLVLLTQTFASPSTERLVQEFSQKMGNVHWVTYDAISESAALDAFEVLYGQRALPDYDFSKAETIVSFGADFLGDWLGGGFDTGYAKGRIPTHGKMSHHIQLEANLTLTGSNADKRIPLSPSMQKKALAKLAGYVMEDNMAMDIPEELDIYLRNLAKRLRSNGKKTLVVSGIDDVDAQVVALTINAYLRSEAIDTSSVRRVRSGSDKVVEQLLTAMKDGRIGGLITIGVNPVYTLPNGTEFAEAMKQLDLSLVFSMKDDETASHAQFVGASSHYLESWGDAEFKKGHYGLMQPTIRPLFDTRQFQDCLLTWMDSDQTYYDYIQDTWNTSVLQGVSWNKALHDGVYHGQDLMEQTMDLEEDESEDFMTSVSSKGTVAINKLAKAPSSGMELTLYSKVGIGDGQQANNPWLQEFPDPISRASWDNYVTMSQADAGGLGVKNWNVANGALNGDYVSVTANGVTLPKVPVIIQPGQAKGTIGLALGYGRTSGVKSELQTGVNAYQLYQGFNTIQEVSVEKVSGEHEFACIQLQNTLMGRGDIIRETTLDQYNTIKDPHSKGYWNPVPEVSKDHQEMPVHSPEVDLWESFERSIGHHFNMSIDLNACTGCGACVIACHAENNVPVVGKLEVRKSRDMHWLRIDRYYSSEATFAEDDQKKEDISGVMESVSGFGELENPSENPQVAFQPVMCQHCNHAPCETVCPVAATSHGRQGQNHMAYNRCVGTRYCANNCPYKVRRFNWFLYSENDEFDFHMNDDLGRMVLNPDVVVRSRGVMEKCSLCIQRTQKTILDAKREGRQIKDGEFNTACSSACATGAIVFGDINDKESEVAALSKSARKYYLLEHVGTKPNVFYHVKVRNIEEV